jgi:hypothetical protein
MVAVWGPCAAVMQDGQARPRFACSRGRREEPQTQARLPGER